jgi:dCTP deaminase
MRTTYKFKGLINVSGFHVDPGWHGQLLFSVYNAGPAEVIVSKGQELFLIVFADLDRDSSQTYKGKSQYQSAIDTSLLQNMTEQVFSPLMLQRQMKDMQDQMGQIRTITYAVSSTAVIVLAIAGVFAAFAPATLGIVLARMMDGGGYEMRLKRDSTQTVESTPVVVQPSASASPVATTPAGSSAASGSRVPSKRD